MIKHKFLKVALHITGCLLFLALPIFTSPDFPKSLPIFTNTPTQRDLIGYFLMICFFYLNFFVLIPKFYFTHKYVSFFGIVLICFLVIAAMPHIILPEKNTHAPFIYPPSNHIPPPFDSLHHPPPHDEHHHQPPPVERFSNYMFSIIHYLFIFLALVFFSLILQVNNRLKQTEKEKLNTELLYLKAQINPHFLFNSLNTIYSLAVENSTNTPIAVIKLSEMMRYVINDTGKDFVALKNEVSYIDNYIVLQKMRFEDLVDVEFQQRGSITGKKIAPLILMPFIENAFKYGVSAQEEKSIITIKLDIKENNLQLLVTNKITNAAPVESSGVGLSNTASRLQLLYPAKHTLFIHNNAIFSVELSLDLS